MSVPLVLAEEKPQPNMAEVKAMIVQIIEAEDAKREDGTSLAGTFVRLAWHAAGTFSCADGTGGSDGGRMRFDPEKNWGANAGLTEARCALLPLKGLFPNVTFADLYTLSGVVAVEHMGGPKVPFSFGRSDETSGKKSPPDGRLPDADKGCPRATISHIRDVFYRMGFQDREVVALLGAHAVGRCHEDASGYWGPWTRAETTFSNEYFRLLLEETWTKKTKHQGKKWTGPEQFEDPTGELMMLPSDLALVQDPEFKKSVELYAKDEALFFKDFAAAYGKLLALGCPNAQPQPPGYLAQLKALVGL